MPGTGVPGKYILNYSKLILMTEERKNKPEADDRHEYIPGVQEKSTIGGKHNTGVTSEDPEEQEQIEKKGSMATLKPKEDRENEGPDQTI